jgi:hypothetical protein
MKQSWIPGALLALLPALGAAQANRFPEIDSNVDGLL